MYTVTIDGKTYEEHQAEINARSLESHRYEIFEKVYPNNSILDDSFPGLTGEALYDRLRPYQTVGNNKIFTTKLTWEDMQQGIADYKSDELAKITSRFDIEQRREDYGARLDNLPHFRAVADELGMFSDYGNMAVLKEKIIVDDLDFELTQIENKHAEVAAEFELQAGVEQKVVAQQIGNKIVATISELNVRNNITPTQIATIYGNATIQSTIMLLQTGALGSAKAQIEALDLTGLEPMDEDYRTRIVGMIDDALGV